MTEHVPFTKELKILKVIVEDEREDTVAPWIVSWDGFNSTVTGTDVVSAHSKGNDGELTVRYDCGDKRIYVTDSYVDEGGWNWSVFAFERTPGTVWFCWFAGATTYILHMIDVATMKVTKNIKHADEMGIHPETYDTLMFDRNSLSRGQFVFEDGTIGCLSMDSLKNTPGNSYDQDWRLFTISYNPDGSGGKTTLQQYEKWDWGTYYLIKWGQQLDDGSLRMHIERHEVDEEWLSKELLKIENGIPGAQDITRVDYFYSPTDAWKRCFRMPIVSGPRQNALVYPVKTAQADGNHDYSEEFAISSDVDTLDIVKRISTIPIGAADNLYYQGGGWYESQGVFSAGPPAMGNHFNTTQLLTQSFYYIDTTNDVYGRVDIDYPAELPYDCWGMDAYTMIAASSEVGVFHTTTSEDDGWVQSLIVIFGFESSEIALKLAQRDDGLGVVGGPGRIGYFGVNGSPQRIPAGGSW